jgi:molecular chaperone GrpE
VDRLHAELQEYKQDLLLNVLRPVFVDLIQLHDDIGKIVDAHSEPEGEIGRLLNLMRGFQQGIEDILYRQGVEPFAHDGNAFDPRRQRAVATVATDDPAANKTIAARHRKGFQAGEKVIRPEVVSVFALKK